MDVKDIASLALRPGLCEFNEGLLITLSPWGPVIVQEQACQAEKQSYCSEGHDDASQAPPGLEHGNDLMITGKFTECVEQSKEEAKWDKENEDGWQNDKVILKQERAEIRALLKVVDVIVQIDQNIDDQQGEGANAHRPQHLAGQVSI